MSEQPNYSGQNFMNINTQLRDLEEKQRILKDRLLLIGENLIEIKEKIETEMLGIKKEIEIITQNMDKLRKFLETASSEFPKFAKKDDLDILEKKIKMLGFK